MLADTDYLTSTYRLLGPGKHLYYKESYNPWVVSTIEMIAKPHRNAQRTLRSKTWCLFSYYFHHALCPCPHPNTPPPMLSKQLMVPLLPGHPSSHLPGHTPPCISLHIQTVAKPTASLEHMLLAEPSSHLLTSVDFYWSPWLSPTPQPHSSRIFFLKGRTTHSLSTATRFQNSCLTICFLRVWAASCHSKMPVFPVSANSCFQGSASTHEFFLSARNPCPLWLA